MSGISSSYIDLDGVGRGGSSSRLAAYRAAMAKKDAGGRLEVGDVTAIRAYLAERTSARREALINKTEPATATSRTVSLSPQKARASTAPALTAQHVHLAAENARKEERKRWEKVFASEQSKGRERVCATLLANSANWSAAAIIAELGNLPTDAARTAQARQTVGEASRKAWDTVIGLAHGQKATPAPDAVGASDAPNSQSTKGDIWDRAIASNWPSTAN